MYENDSEVVVFKIYLFRGYRLGFMYGRFYDGVSKVVVITLFVAIPFLLWLIWDDPTE